MRAYRAGAELYGYRPPIAVDHAQAVPRPAIHSSVVYRREKERGDRAGSEAHSLIRVCAKREYGQLYRKTRRQLPSSLREKSMQINDTAAVGPRA